MEVEQPPQKLECEQQALFVALRDDQEETNRFFSAILGTTPVAEFFARWTTSAGSSALPRPRERQSAAADS